MGVYVLGKEKIVDKSTSPHHYSVNGTFTPPSP